MYLQLAELASQQQAVKPGARASCTAQQTPDTRHHEPHRNAKTVLLL